MVPGWDWRKSKDIVAEEGSGDTIEDAVYRRNLTISEIYNVKFELDEVDAGALNNKLRQNIVAGDDVYTIVCQKQTDVADLITHGDLLNFFSIPYIDLEKPWWDAKLHKRLFYCRQALSHRLRHNNQRQRRHCCNGVCKAGCR